MKRRVLVVEDIQINRQILKKILKDEYEVLEAENGLDALDVLKTEYMTISAVILDLHMPKMSGIEVLKRMRKDTGMNQIPVIVATGTDARRSEELVLAEGANDYVNKPYQANIIRHRVKNVINLREQAAIVNATRIDALTGLYSRRTFFEEAKKLILAAKPGTYVMACFDIERFKAINDQYGNVKGDEVLRNIAAVFKKGYSAMGGICCRVMADHFAALYPKSFIETGELADILNQVVKQEGLIFPLTFSVGRYFVEDVSVEPITMYDCAVLAKETIKGHYEKHIAYYDKKMLERKKQEQLVTSEMRQALEEHQFEAWYQPQYNHATGALIGAEALVRWRHPKRGIISPGVFIPVFEKNGFIFELDKYVWEQACIFLHEMQEKLGHMLPVSVNISRVDVFQDNLVSVIKELVKRYEIPIDCLRLEITESAFSESTGQIIEVVEEFKKLGFTVEIDDFGSGYSSLNTLKDVPADVLKLDMKFLEANKNSVRGGNIIASMVRMAKWIGMSVIAEGVEEMQQADFLKTIGCFSIQGYLYSKPLPKEEYFEILQQNSCEERTVTIDAVETYDNNAFWDPKSLESLIFNSYVGGACIIECFHGNIEILRVNKNFAAEFGTVFSKGISILNTPPDNYLDEDNMQILRRNLEQAEETHRESVCEMKIVSPVDASDMRFFRCTSKVIARTGDRKLVYCVIFDITDMRRAEMNEREAEQKRLIAAERHKLIMDSMIGGVVAGVIQKKSYKIIFANKQFYEMHQCTKEQFEKEGKDLYLRRAHPDDLKRYMSMALTNIQNKKNFSIRYRVVADDQSVRWMFGNVSFIHLSGIEEVVQLMVSNDITELVEAEKHERDAYEKLRKLNEELTFKNQSIEGVINGIPGGFVRLQVSSEGIMKPVYVSEGFKMLVNYPGNKMFIPFLHDERGGIYPDDIPLVKQAFDMLSQNGEMNNIEYRIKCGEGKYIKVNTRGRLQKNEEGTFINLYYSKVEDS